MDPSDSVTHWITQIREGDPDAARALWQRYFPRLVRLAREKLQGAPRGLADEEDVAASVMESLFRATQQGRFPDLADRDDLWRLIFCMAARKTVDLRRHETRQRRGGGHGGREPPGATASTDGQAALAELAGDEPTPDFILSMAEECRRLLDQLEDTDLEKLALAKMEGRTNSEIAEQLKCSGRTVERRLRLIRKKWELELPS